MFFGKMMRHFSQKKQFECNCKHKQETNTRQYNATLGHNEQETQIQITNDKLHVWQHEHINEKMKMADEMNM